MHINPSSGRTAFVAAAAFVAMLSLTQHASAVFSWSNAGATSDPIKIQSLSIAPEPTRPASLPIHWDFFYDPITENVVSSQLTFGRPTGYAGGGLPIALSNPGNRAGSTVVTHTTPVTLAAGNYTYSNVGPASGLASMTVNVPNAVQIAKTDITIEKNVSGIWVEIPGIDYPSKSPVPWQTPGDFYLKFTFLSATDVRLGSYEMYYTQGTLADPYTDGIVAFRAIPEPATLLGLLSLVPTMSRRRAR